MILVIICDLILRVTTKCFDHGLVVSDRGQIFGIQMSKTFLKDFISVTALIIILIDTSEIVSYLSLGFFIQYEQFRKTIEYLEDRFLQSKMAQSIWNLLKLMIGLLYLIHLFCCLWFWVSYNTQVPNWVDSKQLQHSSCALQYLESFYFATVTVLTIGYGDNVPISIVIFLVLRSARKISCNIFYDSCMHLAKLLRKCYWIDN